MLHHYLIWMAVAIVLLAASAALHMRGMRDLAAMEPQGLLELGPRAVPPMPWRKFAVAAACGLAGTFATIIAGIGFIKYG